MKRRPLIECFRWFGPEDPVSLSDIRQCGCSGVFTSLHQIPYGSVWSTEATAERAAQIAEYGLTWEAVESLPVSEAIKIAGPEREAHLENYRQSLKNLGAQGVKTVIYNFMAALDWVRTDLAYRLPNGAESLRYDRVRFAAFEVYLLNREGAHEGYPSAVLKQAKDFIDSLDADQLKIFERSIVDIFPGCKLGLTLDEFRDRLAAYLTIDTETFRENLQYFLKAVIPTAEASGIRLAIHPDDPPFSLFGLPRVVSTEWDIERIYALQESDANGLCFCSGSFGAREDNDLAGIVKRFGHRIHAVHLRNVKREPCGSFYEAGHLDGSSDMAAVMDALMIENGRREPHRTLPYRPDHGHRMLDDLKKPENPNAGYDCIGRLRGLAELRGLQLGLRYQAEGAIS